MSNTPGVILDATGNPIASGTTTPTGSERALMVRQVGSVNIATLPALVAGSAIVGKFGIDQTAGQNIVAVTSLPALPTGTNTIGTTNAPAITKGTQAATGYNTQDLKDAGRNAVVLNAASVASVTAEALISLGIYAGGVNPASAAYYNVTAGKRLRLQYLMFKANFAAMSTTVTFANVTLRVRVVASGAVLTSSPLVLTVRVDVASNQPGQEIEVPIPDGLELAAGNGIGVTHVSAAAAGTLISDVSLVGFEY